MRRAYSVARPTRSIRDQAHIEGKKESDGCAYADSWSNVQFQRMANVSLEPGKTKQSVADMISGVEDGIYIIGDGSFSIDQQRYNAQLIIVIFIKPDSPCCRKERSP